MGRRRLTAAVVAVLGLALAAAPMVPAPPAEAQEAPPFAWLHHLGATRGDTLVSLDRDAAGNLYAVGGTRNDLAGAGSNAGGNDAYVASFAPDGRRRWLRQFGGDHADVALAIAVAPDGSSVVVGETGSATMPGLSGAALDLHDGFVLALDPSGAVRWGRYVATPEWDAASVVALAPDGRISVGGYTEGAIAPGGDPAALGDPFVVQLAPDGTTLWSDQISGDPAAFERTGAIVAAGDGSVYAGGNLRGGSFLVRYVPDGTRAWLHLGAPGAAIDDLALDALGRPVATGVELVQKGSDRDQDVHVEAFDTAGTVRWERTLGTDGSDEYASAIDIDASGALLLCSWTRSPAPGVPPSPDGLSHGDPLVQELDATGNVLRSRRLVGPYEQTCLGGVWGVAGRAAVVGNTAAAIEGAGTPFAGSLDGWIGDFGPAGSAPFASWSALVRRLHLDLLGRSATAPEMARWVEPLKAGQVVPADLVAALRTSEDHVGNVDPVVRLYRAYLLRIPDAGGLRYWIGVRRGGRTLLRISDSFAASSEFTRRYGALSNRAFVELIYRNVLGRAGDETGIAYWTGRLDRRAVSRGAVMLSFSESSEYRRKQAGAVESSVLHLLLGRTAPDPATFAEHTAYGPVVGVDPLRQALATRILASDAYALLVAGSA